MSGQKRQLKRYEHYQRVAAWDRRAGYEQVDHVSTRPVVKKLTRVWAASPMGVSGKGTAEGYGTDKVVGMAAGLWLLTGSEVSMSYSGVSVAGLRLKEGDAVGAKWGSDGDGLYRLLERLSVGEADEGIGVGMDKHGNMSRGLGMPGKLRALRQHYGDFNSLPGRGRTLAVSGRVVGVARLESLGWVIKRQA